MMALLTFYRNFIIPSTIISILGCIFLVQSGSPYFITIIFWMKVLTNFSLGAYHHFFRSQSLLFYYNLGYSQKQLYGFAFLVDFILWIAASIIIINYAL